MTVYQPFEQEGGDRLFVRVRTDPYSIVPTIRRIAHELAPDQPAHDNVSATDTRVFGFGEGQDADLGTVDLLL